ncbi:hypothetical protein AeNC1_000170 [Aphanomyces euteiches]|nr:hypothetical protein AeNC1_000170 [Aphanomyces euteiches]
MSDEDEVTYDIHADGSSKLTKSLQKAKQRSQKVRQVDPTPNVVESPKTQNPTQFARISSYLLETEGDSGDDEDDDFASILQIQTPAAPPAAIHAVDPNRPQTPERHLNLSPQRPLKSQRTSASILRSITTANTAAPSRPRRSLLKTTPRKTPRAAFEAAFDRPSHWLKSPPAKPLQMRTRNPKRTQTTPPLLRNPLPTSTQIGKSMADVLRQATSGTNERLPQTPRRNPFEDIEDAGLGGPTQPGFQSPQQLPFVLPPKEKRRKRLSEVTIAGEIGQVLQRAARKASRDTTLFHTNSHQTLANAAIDVPQNRPHISLCLLRTRLHEGLVIFSAYIHEVSDEAYFSSLRLEPPLLPIRRRVFVDAVFPKDSMAHLRDNVLVTIYSPFHILSLDGPYPFPLLLGTHLFRVTDANHECQTSLPFDDDLA